MIQRFIVIGLLLIFSYSCENIIIANFEVENQTNDKIDSLRIVPSGYESEHYISLAAGETKKYECDMTDIANVDGDYRLDYKIDADSFVSYTFGYYTNGYPIEKSIIIKIASDSIMYDSELYIYY